MIRVLAIALMLLGGMIYVLWRPASLRMFSWFATLGIEQPIAGLHAWASPYASVLPAWVYLSLPQALWITSGCLAVHSVWGSFLSVREQCWLALVLAVAIGGEVGQAIGVVPGVFDSVDLAMILAAFFSAEVIAFCHSRSTQTKRDLR